MTLATTVDVVRSTSTGALTTAADLAAVVALAVLAGVVGFVGARAVAGGGRTLPVVTIVRAAVGATVVAAVLRVVATVQAAGLDPVVLSSRRLVGQVGLAVVVGAAAVVASPRAGLRPSERRAALGLLAVLGVVAIVLSGPRAGSVGALATTTALVLLAAAVAGVAAVLLARSRTTVFTAVALAVTVAAAPSWLALVVPGATSGFDDVVAVEGGEVVLTLAPASTGENELHVYLFDDASSLVVVDGGRVLVDGVASDLLVAGPGHLLGYGVALPAGDAWDLTVEFDRADGGTLTATTEVTRDG